MITSTAIGTGGLGRFGNQMFTIAGVIGIAIKSGQPFGFPKWTNYDNALFGGEVTDFEQFFENKLPEIPEGLTFNDYGYFWGYRDILLPTGSWSINAHLQSGKYFEHCIDKVRFYFRMKDEQEQNEYVAIHYRAGDYIDDEMAYHPRCGIDYYWQAIEKFDKGQKFYFFTDANTDEMAKDGNWYDFFNYLNISMVHGNNYIEDFKLMKKCKSFIIANSSFSAMAAHLGEHPDKKVVAPKRWFGEQANGLSSEDIYSKDWVVI